VDVDQFDAVITTRVLVLLRPVRRCRCLFGGFTMLSDNNAAVSTSFSVRDILDFNVEGAMIEPMVSMVSNDVTMVTHPLR